MIPNVKLCYFYPRPPGGGRPSLVIVYLPSSHFYPRPPGGGRPMRKASNDLLFIFLSTPSGWRATGSSLCRNPALRFLSTPSGWRATGCMRFKDLQAKISIHALRVEGDIFFAAVISYSGKFLSTPSGWRATRTLYWLAILSIFLSTPSGWRATADRLTISAARYEFLSTPSGWRATLANKPRFRCKDCDFYPRPPGGGRR